MFGFGKKKDPAKYMMDLFCRHLDEKKLKYDRNDERHIVNLKYKGDNFQSLGFTMIFDEDGESIAMRVYSIVQFKKAQLADAYNFCNEMNVKYRWLRFYVDSDDELTAAMDAVISEESCAAECLEVLSRTVSIVDDVCGELHS